MTSSSPQSPSVAGVAAEPEARRELPPAAQRARAEAAARRAAAQGKDAPQPREVGGREGPEPTRYGDWEKGGIASDF